MKKILRLIPIIYICAFIPSCKKGSSNSNGNPVGPVYSIEAQTFFDSSGITDLTQKTAVDSLVKQLKDSLLWTKFMAIYPMVGGSAGTTKWNLKDPRNSDAAYRLTFNGTPVFASTGVLFPTKTDYADTHLTDAVLTYNDNSISYYSETENNISGYDMGCNDTMAPYNEMAILNKTDATTWFKYYDYAPSPLSTKGLFMLSATASNVIRYENGILKNSRGMGPVAGSTGFPILIGTVANAPSVGMRECALATIGYGLTDVQAITFYNIVRNFQAALGR